MSLRRDPIREWTAYNDTPWGRLRLDILWANLTDAEPFPPSRVLDCGAGTGEIAIRLAQAGSSVRAVDSSEKMLQELATRAERVGVEIRTTVADLDVLPPLLEGEKFDAILCHNVLGYVEDPAATCVALAQHLAGEGYLSVLVTNRSAEPIRRAVSELNLVAARDALVSRLNVRTSEVAGRDLALHDVEDVASWFRAAALELVYTRGVRVLNDYIDDVSGFKWTTVGYRDLLDLELELTRLAAYIPIAAMVQAIGRNVSL